MAKWPLLAQVGGVGVFSLVANTLALNTFLIILGSFCAEDFA